MKPFLFISVRPEPFVYQNERDSIIKYSTLTASEIVVHNIWEQSIHGLQVNQFQGLIVGGSPLCVSTPLDEQPEEQRRLERELTVLIKDVVVQDFPYLGICYGLGILVKTLGGVVDRTYGEASGVVKVELTSEGTSDGLFSQVDTSFLAFTGHLEAVSRTPREARVLASTKQCPTHVIRVKNNVYGTQFHPELDVKGKCLRIDAYRDLGYFPAGHVEELKAAMRATHVTQPQRILQAFVDRYR